MWLRCTRPSQVGYKNYGGRGVKVCKRWEKFEAFLADMGERPEGLSLERIDNDGNYEPSNCRWATRKEQGNNSRKNRHLTWKGETKTLSEWARLTGIASPTIRCRIDRYGWTVARALKTTSQLRPVTHCNQARQNIVETRGK